MAGIEFADISGEASPEEVAAIMAAVELTWPRGVMGTDDDEPVRWRFSGRWWTKPMPLRRDRPF